MSDLTIDATLDLLSLKELAISKTHDGIALLDSEGRYYYLNEAHVKPFGYEHENELLGKTWQAIYPPEEIERLERDMVPLLVEHGKWTGETRGITKQGTPVFQEISLTFLEDGGMICVTRIINKEKEYERELQLRAMKMHSVVEHMSDGICLEDRHQTIRVANPALFSLLGITGNSDDIVGQKVEVARLRISSLLKDPDYFTSTVKSRITGGVSATDKIELLSGTTLQREFIPIVINDASEGYLWVYKDVTSREESKRKLESLIIKEQGINEVKSKLIQTISHEFKQPLNNAIDSLKILRSMTDNDSDSYSRPWEYLSMELQRLNQNVSRIVNFESLYQSRKANLTIVNAKNLVSNFLNYNYKMFMMTGKFEFNDEMNEQAVGVDMNLVELAFRNLIDNAIKYSNPNEAIHIKCFSLKETAHFVFENKMKQGLKVEPDKLGTPFYRGNNNEQGLGLGLSIIDHSLQLMSGEVKFESEGEIFSATVTLPISEQ